VAVDKTYNYSDAMKSQTMNWDYANLDSYLAKPNAMVKGTKMAFAGIKKPEDRRDLIAYLALQSDDKKIKD
jgi:cytochrome c